MNHRPASTKLAVIASRFQCQLRHEMIVLIYSMLYGLFPYTI